MTGSLHAHGSNPKCSTIASFWLHSIFAIHDISGMNPFPETDWSGGFADSNGIAKMPPKPF
jgi:hypothetical protein